VKEEDQGKGKSNTTSTTQQQQQQEYQRGRDRAMGCYEIISILVLTVSSRICCEI
jgi:hypothetical protein